MKLTSVISQRVKDRPGIPMFNLPVIQKALLSVFFLLFVLCSRAADFPVTNTNNAGTGSLRQAILDMNAAGSGPHTIRFDVYGQITLLTSLPAITQTVTIDGQNKITLNSNGANASIDPFDIRANNVVVRNFSLTNNGNFNFILRANTTGVTIENIRTSSTTGNFLNFLVLVTGNSTNLTLRNLWCSDLEPNGRAINFSGGTHTGVVMDNIHLSSQDNKRALEGIVFRDANINGWTLTNSNISGFANGIVLDNASGVAETANNIELDNVVIDSLYSGVGMGFYSDLVNTDFRIKNTVIDMDVVGSGNDADYPLRFDNTTNGILLENVTVKDADLISVWFNAAAQNITIDNLHVSDPTPGDGYAGQFLRFEKTANTVSIKNSVFDADKLTTTNDAEIGIAFQMAASDVTIDNIKVNEFDGDGLHVVAANTNFQVTNSTFTNNFDGIEFYNNVARTNVDIINTAVKTSTRGGILINGANAITDIDLTGDTLTGNASHGVWFYGGAGVTDVQITGSVISNNGGAGVYNDAPNKVIISNNSIFDNTAPGIALTTGNCGYTSAAGRTPVLVASTNLGGGQYQLQITIPNITAGAQYTVDIYANDPATARKSGQYFVTSLNNLSSGTSTHTITYNAGPGATGIGFWTATLRIPANNCGTSEFSNSLAMGIKAPACITNGIVGWYRADMAVNGRIWGDISGNANHTTIVGDPDTAEAYVNYNPAFYYDGNDAHTVPATAGVSGAYTIMGLGKLEGSLNRRVFSSTTGNKLLGWHNGGENGYYNEGWGRNTVALTNHTRLYSIERTNTGSGPYEFKGNGALLASNAVSNGAVWTLNIGSSAYGEFSRVFVPEVFIYNRDLTAAEILRLESYMGLKYGITLNNGLSDYLASDGTTIMWSAASNTGYNRHITGIGKDDCTMLHQKQSLSADSGIIVIALGNAVKISNAANTNAVTVDKTFLVFGDNSGSAKIATPVTATNVTQRMARVWKVQKSATWADQTITLKVNGAGNNNYLLISSDASFASIGQELALDINGQVTINSSLLANGAYFTVAGNIKGPANVNAGVALWVKADDGAASGVSWNDISGNASGVVQSITTRQPSVLASVINFNPVLKFDGTDDFMMGSSLFTGSGVNNVQVYAVTTTDIVKAHALFGEQVSNGQQIQALVPWSDANLYFDAPYSYRAQAAWGGTVNTPYLWSFLRSPSTMSGNRNRIAVASYTAALNNIAGSGKPFHIGSANGGTSNFNGRIAELIVYNNSAATTNTQRQQIESYLALKYGLTLSPATPVDYLASNGSKFWDATLNNGYNRNITGVGRDNASYLLQKQSVSVDDKYLTMSLGTSIAASNAANTADIAGDLSFFVAGDNNGAKLYSVSIAGIPNVNVALARTWKVQKSNWTDQDITFQTDTASTVSQYLVISSDAVFGAGDLALPMTKGMITVNTSQLPDGSFFTFANNLKGPGGVSSGIGAWYKGDFGLKPSVWNDYSGNGFNIYQPIAGSQPSVVANGVNFNPGASFTSPQFFGPGGHIVDPASSVFGNAIPQNIAVFGVSTIATGTGGGGIFGQTTTNNYPVAAVPSYNNETVWDAPYAYRLTTPFTGTLNKQNVWGFTKTTSNMSIFKDRATIASANNSYVYTGTGGNYASHIGVSNSVYFSGKITEVIVYRDITALTATDKLKIESYLALKYGVTLDLTGAAGYTATDGSVYFNAITNAGYLKHITGIGRDSVTDLHHKQSVSADDSLLTLALGNAVATTNASNSNTITNDRSFFVVSDNDANSGYVIPLAGYTDLNSRMARIFRVSKTNWADQSITLKLRNGNAQTWLLISTDAVFDASDTRIALNADSTITLNSSSLPDGIYFSFAKNIKGPNGVNDGVNFWMRADDGRTTGSSWKDYAGHGHEAIQATTVSQPTTDARAINFNYGLKFDGTNDFIDINTTRIDPDNSTIFVAGTGSGFSTARNLIGAGAVGSAVGMEFRMGAANSFQYIENNNAVQTVAAASTFIENRPYLWSATQTNATDGVRLFQNFRADGQGTISLSPSMANLVSIGSKTLGAREFYWQGNISEVIAYNRVLTDLERQSVESYLAIKYGITLNNGNTDYLSSDNTVYWTTDASFKSRVTGIGRDDSTSLNTKQSLAADTGFVTLALGNAIALTNDINSNTITNNKSFFVFADNGLSASNFTVAVSGSANNVTRRLARVWKVQKTNWADQNITLKIKPIGIGNYMLIGSDPDFAGFTMELPVPNDGVITLPSSYFNNTDLYFTFGGPLKSPGGIAGYSLWVRADVGTSVADNNSRVDEWSDMSSFGNLLRQTNTAAQPFYQNNLADNINFNPVMRFGGAGYIMSGQSVLKTGTYTGATAFLVNNQAVTMNASVFNEMTASTGNFNLHATWGDNQVYWDAPVTTNRLIYNAGNIIGQSNLWTAFSDISLAAAKQQLFKNGLSVATGNNNGSFTGNNNAFNLGGTVNGRMPELIIYTTPLTAGQRDRVNTYLAIKYGITLNNGNTSYIATNGTTTVWDATANATHKSNIAGIGRDDDEILNQKQARSVNTGFQVTIGLGSIDSTNTANTNNFADDISYLVWGDDNASAIFNTPFNFNGVNYRTARTWKVQETGTVGSVMIAIPESSIPDPTVAYLVLSSDAGFDGADQFIQLTAATINNVKYRIANVDLTNGQYFTFADFVRSPGGVTGTTQWFRADAGTDATADNTENTEWKDYSNNLNSLLQANVASQPKFMNNVTDNMNFNPVLLFDGTNDYYNLNSDLNPTAVNPHSNFMVYKPYAAGRGLFGNDNGTFDLGHFTSNVEGNGNTIAYTGGNTLRMPVINESYYMHSGAADSRVYINHRQQLAFVYANATGGDATSYLGANGINCAGCSSYFSGPVGEYIRYNKVLTATERLRVNTYLSLKYGVSIDQTVASNYLATDGTTVVWDATVNATYKFGITGIGRDDVEGLGQKQSRNSDTTRLNIAIGLGALAESNLDNSNSFSSDINYMIWGDNNGAVSFKTIVTGKPEVNYRMTRIWKVQETGTVGEVEVAVPFDALPNPRQSFLVISNDEVFDNADTYIPLYDVTLNNKKHWAAKANFSTNQYFTIASYIKSPGGVGVTNLWMRADQGIQNNTDGTPVDLWVDFGNEVNNASQSVTASQPVFSNNATANINYNPVVTFNGSSHQMNLDITKLPTGNAARTLIGVGNPANITGNRYLIGYGTGTANTGSGLLNQGGSGMMTGYTNEIIAPGLWQLNTTNEMTGTFAGAGGQAALYSKVAPVGTAGNRAWVTGTGGATLGNSPWAAEFWNGTITEVIAFDRALTNTERQRVTSYLAIRNGYTMDQATALRDYLNTSGNVIWNGTANTVHNKNIAGIGRDDVEGLNQKQSKSIHAGSILAIGLGEIATDNPANTNTFAADQSYMIWGSNSTALTVSTTDLPALFSQRLTQEWKTSLSNFNNQAQAVAMEFDLTGITHNGTNLSDFTLLIDTDGDGDFTTGTIGQVAATEYENNKLRFSSVSTLSHNAVFTVAFGPQSLRLSAKAILQGAWNGATMSTGLKTAGLLPDSDPYGQGITPSVTPNSTTAQVVDWVKVELRDGANPATVVDTRVGFVLSNGTIVDTGYVQPISFFNAPSANYYVVIRHRNHLGVMSAGVVDFSSGTGVIDFTLNSTATYGTHARKDLGSGVMGLWAGDVNADGAIRHSATPSDATPVSNAVMNHENNTARSATYTGYINVYSPFDLSFDGRIYYKATPSDHAIILNNVKTHPGNTFGITSYIIKEQLP